MCLLLPKVVEFFVSSSKYILSLQVTIAGAREGQFIAH